MIWPKFTQIVLCYSLLKQELTFIDEQQHDPLADCLQWPPLVIYDNNLKVIDLFLLL